MKIITKQILSVSLAAAFLLFTSTLASAQSAQFPIDLGAKSTSTSGSGIAVDKQNNSYITGTFNNTLTFNSSGGGALISLTSSSGLSTVYVAKLNSAGVCLWAFAIGTTLDNNSYGIAVDAAGDVYVTGSFQGTATFNPAGGGNITALGTSDVFVAKYNTSGIYLWAFNIGSTGKGITSNVGYSIAVDAAGNVYVTGGFYNTANFKGTSAGPNNLSANGYFDSFLAKYNSLGAYQWAFSLLLGDYNSGIGVATDASNNVLITGEWFAGGTANFEGTSGTSTMVTGVGFSDAYVAKYNPEGVNLWAFIIGGTSTDLTKGGNFVGGITTDANNNVLVTGSFSGTANFKGTSAGPNTLQGGTGSNGSDIFVAKYDSTGAYQWAFSMGSPADADWGSSIATDASGNVAITGDFQGAADFKGTSADTNILTANGTTDIFVAEYNSAGAYQCAFNIGSSANTDGGTGIAVDTFGNELVTGSYIGAANFNPLGIQANLTTLGYQDAFVSKYSDCMMCLVNPGINQSICTSVTSSVVIGAAAISEQYYSWSPATALSSSTVSEPTASPTVTTTYTVTMTKPSSGCLATNTVIVSVGPNPKPVVSASGPTTFCLGGRIELNSSSGYVKYHWIDGSTTQNIDVSTPGIYSVTVTSAIGCSGFSDTVTVTVSPFPAATTGPDQTICHGGAVTIGAIAVNGDTYNWAPATGLSSSTLSQPTASPTVSTWYTLTVTSASGCHATDSVLISVSTQTAPATPVISASGPTTFCEGGSVTLNTTAGYTTYVWSNGATTQSIDVDTQGDYRVTVSNSAGCSAISSDTSVTVNQIPSAPVISQNGDTLFCSIPASSYQWYNDTSLISGATGIFYLPSEKGSYKVIITQGGCSSSSSLFTYTGINTVSAVNPVVAIYPSPASSYITAESKTTPLQTVTIYDVLGTRILNADIKDVSISADDKKARINIQYLSSGVYFVQLKTNNAVSTLRFVKD